MIWIGKNFVLKWWLWWIMGNWTLKKSKLINLKFLFVLFCFGFVRNHWMKIYDFCWLIMISSFLLINNVISFSLWRPLSNCFVFLFLKISNLAKQQPKRQEIIDNFNKSLTTFVFGWTEIWKILISFQLINWWFNDWNQSFHNQFCRND